MSLHAEVLSPEQQQLLRRLAPVATASGFVLGGGTAVAIHLGHRRSLDFDWLTEAPLPDPLALAQQLRSKGVAFETDTVERGTLHGRVESVRISFLEYRYPALRPPVTWADYDCTLTSLEDLACMKLSAIAGRGARKDFVDAFALGRDGLPLPRMLSLYRERYAVRDVGHVVFSLTYFDDAEREPMPDMLWSMSWEEMKRAIASWVRELDAQRWPANPG